ncbi:uncharacterized protein LOC133192992 [Saccostrea echinata]|uniref:uncharacterized protein LOC133192992 n=1 Tax=Saccostrea echinata TaxID=191078 RepID=UPI002A817565|nr:uncharacterized protein LOC133192992 [Saccostrea echinata]
MTEKREKIPQQITENKELCDAETEKLQKHFDELISRLAEIKKRNEQKLRENLVKKNDQLNLAKSKLDKMKRGIANTVEFMEENNSTMSDYSLIDSHRKLIKMLSELEVHMTNCEYSMRFTRGEIKDDLIESLIGRFLDLNVINSVEKVNTQGAKEHKFRITGTCDKMCVIDNNVYFIDAINTSISCLSPSGSVSTVISTDPLVPRGICQSVSGGLLVTLTEATLDLNTLESHCRCLLRHITMTGDVIHEYEYQEDGETKLLTLPYRITQNGNCDICVANCINEFTCVLLIMSPSGRMKSVYHGQNLTENFDPSDVVCDSLCNILVTDPRNKQIHLLSPDGEFLKFLLTDNEVNHPVKLSLYKSTLWVGYDEGLVKVFQYSV